MIYAPSDLRAIKLRDVPAGTVLGLTHVADIPLAVKLADHDECSSWILALSGEYPFHVIPWSDDSEIATLLCEPNAVRFKLGSASQSASHHTSGVLTLHSEGALIATNRQGQIRGPKVDVASWGFVKGVNLDSGCAIYPTWDIGQIDAKHDFISLHSHK